MPRVSPRTVIVLVLAPVLVLALALVLTLALVLALALAQDKALVRIVSHVQSVGRSRGGGGGGFILWYGGDGLGGVGGVHGWMRSGAVDGPAPSQM